MTPSPPLHGLVLAGGASRRMNRDKAALVYPGACHGKPQLLRAFELLQGLCEQTFISVRAGQTDEPLRAGLPQIVDRLDNKGPIAGIHAAQTLHPQAAWLVLACDLPFLDRATLEHLLAGRGQQRIATAYRSSQDGLPEPLCAIYEPHSREAMAAYIDSGGVCPRKFLAAADVCLLDQPDPHALDNINTADEYRAATNAPKEELRIQVRYYAVLREQAGRSTEEIVTCATTPALLYEELRTRHTFRLAREHLKVAVNSEFSDWSHPLQDNDSVVFIPPVAGG